MNFDAANDDEYFNTLGKSNNLEELLIEDVPGRNSAQMSYPISHQTSESSTNWTTSWAKVANAFKNNHQVGKVGVAILSHFDLNQHKIIIYKTKVNILGTATVNKTLRYIHKYSNYIQFYDDHENYWSILFNKEDDEAEFKTHLKEIGLHISNQENEPSKIKGTSVERTINSLNKTPMTAKSSNVNSESPGTEFNTHGSMPMKPLITPRKLLNSSSPNTKTINHSNGETSAKANVYGTKFVQILLSENRAQNSDMRMSLTKLETKVDNVLAKLNSLHFRTEDIPNKVDEILQLEEKILILKKENRKLTLKFEQSQKINEDMQNGSLLQLFENELQRIGIANTTDLNVVIRSLLEKIKILEIQLKESEDLNTKKCKELQESIKGLHEQNMKVIERHSELELAINSLEIAMQESKGHNKKLEQELAESKHMNAEKVALQKVETLNMIKTIMNNLHLNLCNTIENSPAMDIGQTLGIIGKSIREETFKCIHKLNGNIENID